MTARAILSADSAMGVSQYLLRGFRHELNEATAKDIGELERVPDRRAALRAAFESGAIRERLLTELECSMMSVKCTSWTLEE